MAIKGERKSSVEEHVVAAGWQYPYRRHYKIHKVIFNSPCLIKLFSMLTAEKLFKVVYVSALLSRILAVWG